MRRLGGKWTVRRAVKNSEKKSLNPRTSLSLVPTSTLGAFAPGSVPAQEI